MNEKVSILALIKNPIERKRVFEILKGSGLESEIEFFYSPNFEEKIKEKSYDIIITDSEYDGQAGLRVVQTLRTFGRDSPVILLVSRDEEREALRSLRKGIAEYILEEEIERIPIVLERVLTHRALERQRERLNELFKESERRYKSIIESSMDGIIVLLGDRIVFANPMASEILGIERKELIGGRFECARKIASSKNGKRIKECIYERGDGSRIWIEIAETTIRWEGLDAKLLTFRDITYRKLAEEELKRRSRIIRILKEFRENVLNSLGQGVVVLDREGKIRYINPAIERFFGWTQRKLNKSFFEQFDSLLGGPGIEEAFREIVEGKREYLRLKYEDRRVEERHYLFYFFPFRERRKITGAVVVVEDVTEQVILENLERKRVEELSTIHEMAREVLFSKNPSELLEKIGKALRRRFNFDDVLLVTLNDEGKIDKFVLEGVHAGQLTKDELDIKSEKTPIGYVLKRKEPLLITDVRKKRETELVFKTNVSSLTVPIRKDGDIKGIIHIENHLVETFDEIDLKAFETLGDELVSAMEYAELFEALTHRNYVLEFVNNLSRRISKTLDIDHLGNIITDSLLRHFPYYREINFYYLSNGNGLRLVARKPSRRGRRGDSKIVEEALKKKKTLVWDKGKMKELAIPIVRGKEVIAILHVKDKAGEITEWDVIALEALGEHISSSIQNAKYLGEIRKRLEELKTLNELGKLLTSTIEMDILLEEISNFLKHLFNTDTYYIALYDESKKELVFEIDYEKGKKLPPSSLPVETSKGFTAWIFREKKPLLIRDMEREKDSIPVQPIIEGEPSRSFLGVPIVSKGKALGVISLQSFEPDAFDEKDLELLTTLSSHIGTALENASLLREKENYLLRLKYLIEAVYTISEELDLDKLLENIVRIGTNLFDTEWATIYYIRGDKMAKIIRKNVPEECIKFFIDNHKILPGWKTYEKGIVTRIDDIDKAELPEELKKLLIKYGVKNYIVVPMRYRGNSFGVMVFYRKKPIPFNDEDIEMALTLARHAAVAIMNAELFTNVKISEEKYRNLFQNANDAIFLVDPATFTIIEANSYAEKLIGIPSAKIVGKHFRELTPISERKKYALVLKKLLEEGNVRGIDDLHIINKKKKTIPVEMSAQKVNLGDREVLQLILRDITERKKAEQEIKRRLKELKTLYFLGIDISSARDMDSLLEKVYRYVVELFSVDNFYIALYDEEKDALVFELEYDEGKRQRKRTVPLKDARGFTGWIFRNNQPVLIRNWDLEWWAYPIVPLDKGKSTLSYMGVPLKYKENVLGVMAVQEKKKNAFDDQSLELLMTMANQIGVAIQNLKLIKDLSLTLKKLEESYEKTLETLVNALDFREHETQFHSKRVALYAVKLGELIGLSREDLKYIYWGGLLHDIGKIGVSDNILLKPGPLTEEEWKEMRKHPEIGYAILKDVDFLGPAKDIVLYHHERWDGKGYPFGLKGREIPLYARIFAIADALDAITSDRPYRKARTFREAKEEIRRNSGTQFDPEIAAVFLKEPLKTWKEIRKKVKDENRNRIQNYA